MTLQRERRDDACVQGNGDEYRERSKLTAIEPRDRHQRSHWLLLSDRYAYAYARANAINTPALEQTSFSTLSDEQEGVTTEVFTIIRGAHLGSRRYPKLKKVCTILICHLS